MNPSQIILLISTLCIGFQLERLERKNFKLFRGIICMLALTFNLLSTDFAVHNHTPSFSPSQELILKI